jgi:hypothetical protein
MGVDACRMVRILERKNNETYFLQLMRSKASCKVDEKMRIRESAEWDMHMLESVTCAAPSKNTSKNRARIVAAGTSRRSGIVPEVEISPS